jgi:LPXTG-motif cell wall-anchored protein
MDIRKNKSAIAPLIIVGVLAIIGVTSTIAVYQLTQRPDITYNISDTGVSFAGIDVSWFAIIGIVVLIAIFLVWSFRKRKPVPPTQPPPTPIFIREFQ